MAKSREDVAQNLKSYFMGCIEVIEKEYGWQIAKWKSYLKKVVAAQKAAQKSQNDILDKVQKDAAAASELGLLTLSFVGGMAIRWLSEKVKSDIYPRYASKIDWQDGFTNDGYASWRVASNSFSDARARFFGDSILVGGGLALNKVIKAVTPSGPKVHDKAINAPLSYLDYENRISLTFDSEIQSMLALLAKMYTNANNNLTLGQSILDDIPESKNPRIPPDQLEVIGVQRIASDFDKIRADFAKNWYYFGNNPDLTYLTSLDDRIEVELWALWILDQDFKYHTYQDSFTHDSIEVRGKDDIPLTHRIFEHLTDDLFQTAMIDNAYATLHYSMFGSVREGAELGADGNLAEVIAWAKRNTGKILKGQLRTMPRSLGSVADANSIFGQ